MNFAQRHGLEAVTKPFQVDGVNDHLRNRLWSEFDLGVLSLYKHLATRRSAKTDESNLIDLLRCLWISVFKQPVDTINPTAMNAMGQLRQTYFKLSWVGVYEFLEQTVQFYQKPDPDRHVALLDRYNHALEAEWSAYRFVGNQLARVTDPTEIRAIESAARLDDSVLAPVSAHIKLAVGAMADRVNPDYRTSMKESISAVEVLCKLLAKLPDATLTPALDAIKNKLGMHKNLSEGLKNLYWYTSDSGGIRHSYKPSGDVDPDPAEAQFLLVTCAAFINFMVEKARAAKLL